MKKAKKKAKNRRQKPPESKRGAARLAKGAEAGGAAQKPSRPAGKTLSAKESQEREELINKALEERQAVLAFFHKP